MGVTVLPGFGEMTAPSLQELGQNLEKFLKPNEEFQKAMQKAIGGNPQLAQGFADLEHLHPGTLHNMGFGYLGDALGQLPESPDQKFARDNADALSALKLSQVKQASAQSALSLKDINDTLTYIQSIPKGSAPDLDRLHALLKIASPEEQALQAAQTTNLESETTTRKAELPGVQAESDVKVAEAPTAKAKAAIELKNYQQLLDAHPDLQGIDYVALARKFLPGGKATAADNQQRYMLILDPNSKELYDKASSFAQEDMLTNLRENATQQHEFNTMEHQDELLDKRQSFDSWQKSGNIGTPSAWYTASHDPKAVEAARNVTGPKTQEEKDLISVADFQAREGKKLQDAQISTVISAITKTQNDIALEEQKPNPDPGAMQTLTNSLQLALNAKQQQFGGDPIIVRYGPRPPVGADKVTKGKLFGDNSDGTGTYFVDKDGKRIPDADINKISAAAPTSTSTPKNFDITKVTPSKLSPSALSAYQIILSGKGTLDQLKTDKPGLYNEIISAGPPQ